MAMNVQMRGGVPRVRVYASVPTTGINVVFEAMTNYIEIRNEGAQELRIYVVEADFTGTTVNYIPVAAAATYLAPAELRQMWLVAGAATTAVRVIAFYTR